MAIAWDSEYPLNLNVDEERRLMNFFLVRLLSSSVSVSYEVFSFCMRRVGRFEQRNELDQALHLLLPKPCWSEVPPCSGRDLLFRILLADSIEPRHVPVFSDMAEFFALSEFKMIHEKRYRICFFYMPLTVRDHLCISEGLDRLSKLKLIASVYSRS